MVPMRTTVAAIVIALGLAAASFGCGSAPSTPSPAPLPSPVVNIAGNWNGTFESENFSTRTIAMTVVQGGNCVDGVWTSGASDWTGAISGFAGPDSFSGQISFEAVTESGDRCTGVGNTSGQVGSDTLRWTSTGFTAVGQCTGTLPKTIVISLRRS
jgi:hypothetical protein